MSELNYKSKFYEIKRIVEDDLIFRSNMLSDEIYVVISNYLESKNIPFEQEADVVSNALMSSFAKFLLKDK